MILRVNVVLNRTVVVDSDSRFETCTVVIFRVKEKYISKLDSEDDYRTGCRNVIVNNNSPIQDYVHPDDQTQPTLILL